MKAVSMSLSYNISVMFQATLHLYAYFINHSLAVLCKFLSAFWRILGWRRKV